MKNDHQDDFAIAVLKERLRQARCSFDLAIFGLVVCGVVEVCGVGLILTGKASEGSLMGAGATGAIAACLQVAKDANGRLDRVFEEMQEEKSDC
ncbi:MAG: hypothetical protein HC860_23360 [Alkalinema sp. RU_4_3]|nr:hypothetical protein [Alkalinema sp. RU_4_3]